MFKHVLVPLDVRFSPQKTLMAAAALAREQNAQLTLLNVCDVGTTFANAAFTVVTDDEVTQYAQRVQAFLADASAIIAEYGGNASRLVVAGAPVHLVIKAVAAQIGADAIMMGTHGRRGFARFWHGSVTERLLRDADVPVLAIRESPTMSLPRISPQWSAQWQW